MINERLFFVCFFFFYLKELPPNIRSRWGRDIHLGCRSSKSVGAQSMWTMLSLGTDHCGRQDTVSFVLKVGSKATFWTKSVFWVKALISRSNWFPLTFKVCPSAFPLVQPHPTPPFPLGSLEVKRVYSEVKWQLGKAFGFIWGKAHKALLLLDWCSPPQPGTLSPANL